ncbi:uncharacterized protein BXZ73DRAFT_105115 [Epithele typhae]|uniref:uncharacterized protein n=1 Tax=Epithele typhae TaxID=378194 RepID=UPI002007F1FA|nr:uncharacterized protein BXZ73DRAFT_105115 [Epithele typhae]KAH9918717.1 hypothetical protein BXZ73DRAFT_105115 [Epithele typhae]
MAAVTVVGTPAAELTAIAFQSWLIKVMGVASATFFALEVISTMSDEIRFVWPTAWSITKIIYFLNRYSPIANFAMSSNMFFSAHTPETCLSNYVPSLCTFLSEAVLAIRTFALWDFNLFVVGFLSFLTLCLVVVGLVVLQELQRHVVAPDQATIDLIGCIPYSQDTMGWSLVASILVGQTAVVVLTIYKNYNFPVFKRTRNRANASGLLYTLILDGILHYLIMLGSPSAQ